MKIRLRLTLFFILCAAAALIGCGAVLLSTCTRSNLKTAEENAISELSMLATSLTKAASTSSEPSMSDMSKRSLTVYLFQEYADAALSGSQYALMQEGKALYNNTGYDLAAMLDGAAQAARVIDQQRFFVATTEAYILLEPYQLYLMRDVSSVYESNQVLRDRFILISTVALILTAGIIALVTYRALRPLKRLEESAVAMASGDYDQHIPISGRDEIATLSDSFNRMADSVQQHVASVTATAEERRMLLGALTHEIKTPMTAIIGYAETLERARLSDAQREKAIRFIKLEGRRLERLTQKMMRLITLTDGEEIECRDTPAKELFGMVEETLMESAARQSVALRFMDADAHFVMDADLMASVLINLVDNACSAGARNVVVRAADGMLSVSDDGCGIPTEIIDRVTQPFFMADKSRSRKHGNSGLGLALVARIAALHRADLKIESEAGIGTTVLFMFSQ